ncbi:MAG TPA: tRNA (adenosine(37)-N6)-dimethylallyltransferase MiaA [Anaerolineaceae bacterium]|nr:tRNA (adenosine(37)-N6)-dimethylallyltransferase MiaA [Anaerolineaceae bacterium]
MQLDLMQSHKFPNKRVLVLVGATAVGKTEMAVHLAEKLRGEIVSADSRLLYRGMDIGTAKPTKKEMERAPHHMIDLAEPDEIWSLATFQKKMLATIGDIQAREKLPIVAGGTGQYIRSMMEGWIIPTVLPDPRLREVLEKIGLEIGAAELHRRLSLIDPIAASKMDANNLRRSIRALEVIFTTGELFSEQKDKQPPDLDFKLIGLSRSREVLYDRVDSRIETMFNQGFVEEVRKLMDKGYNQSLPTLSAIGYREVMQYLNGDITIEETKVQMRKKTREFIRRQANWFKPNDPLIEWHTMDPDPLDDIMQSIHRWQAGEK